jgi:hypothetical protein
VPASGVRTDATPVSYYKFSTSDRIDDLICGVATFDTDSGDVQAMQCYQPAYNPGRAARTFEINPTRGASRLGEKNA